MEAQHKLRNTNLIYLGGHSFLCLVHKRRWDWGLHAGMWSPLLDQEEKLFRSLHPLQEQSDSYNIPWLRTKWSGWLSIHKHHLPWTINDATDFNYWWTTSLCSQVDEAIWGAMWLTADYCSWVSPNHPWSHGHHKRRSVANVGKRIPGHAVLLMQVIITTLIMIDQQLQTAPHAQVYLV